MERGLIEIGPLPLEALLRAPEGSAVGFYYEPSSEDLPLDFGGLSVHGSEHVEGRHGSMIEANKLFGLIDENSSRVGEESGGTLHVPSSPRPPPPTDAPPAPAPPTTPPPLPPPPRFVVVDRMRRERRCCGLFRTGKIIASYSLDSAQSDNEVQPGMVIHPVEAHRRISHWYTEMINLGHGHDEVLEELERISKLPPGWRDSTMPYWGAFDGAKKRTGWRLNYLLHTLLIAILIMDYLTLQDTIPFTAVGESLLIGFFVEPLLEAVWLLFRLSSSSSSCSSYAPYSRSSVFTEDRQGVGLSKRRSPADGAGLSIQSRRAALDELYARVGLDGGCGAAGAACDGEGVADRFGCHAAVEAAADGGRERDERRLVRPRHGRRRGRRKA